MSKELIEKAQELGIQNAETLTASQLKKAIEAAEKKQANSSLEADDAKQEFSKQLHEKAAALKIDTEGVSDENLEVIVSYIEEFKALANKESREAELSAMLSEFLGVEDVYELSKEEIQTLLAKKETEKAAGLEVVLEPVEEGKTDETITVNGQSYGFAEDAPAAFRYLGQLKTQQEWISDKDAVELMVAGNLAFLTLKK